jgi:hypothetical protein
MNAGGPLEAPTAVRYLLYLDFQADGQAHTAGFAPDAAHGDGTGTRHELAWPLT